MIVTIDGPAGAGKSDVARRLARGLGFDYLDTGAMYRAVAWAAMQAGIDGNDETALTALAGRVRLEQRGRTILLDGQDVSEAIRRPDVTRFTRHVADCSGAREHLVRLQREAASGRDMVTEGRDQGTVAFPDAACKIFLTASPEERARRRFRQLRRDGTATTFEEVLADQLRRDREDETRPVGALVAAPDAIWVYNDDLTLDETVERLVEVVRGKRS